MPAFILLIPIFFAIIAATLFLSAYRAQRDAAPFYPSRSKVIRMALREAKLGRGERFYDLGAGTGKTLIIADREFGAVATGFEISIIPYCIAKLNLFFNNSRSKVLFKSLFTQNLNAADVVFCFLLPRTMKKLEGKLMRELHPGARIISYAFPLPSMQPEKTITIRDGWQVFIYKKHPQ